jgi:regulator of ribonuclease activity A
MAYSVPDICDNFPEDISVLEPQFREFGKRPCFCGEIVTIKCFEDNSLLRELLGSQGAEKVIVVDGGGSLRHALLGDLLAAKAVEHGWAGLVINGCVRDVEILSTLDLGIRALNCHPLKTEKRGEGQFNVPVNFAGVRFQPGQFIYADANGIVLACKDLNIDFHLDP